jgi:hypothetical protein
MSEKQLPDRNLALELVRVTEAAALAASRWMGRGDKNGADGAAVTTWEYDHEFHSPVTQVERASETSPARCYSVVTDFVGTPTHLVSSTGDDGGCRLAAGHHPVGRSPATGRGPGFRYGHGRGTYELSAALPRSVSRRGKRSPLQPLPVLRPGHRPLSLARPARPDCRARPLRLWRQPLAVASMSPTSR